MTRQLAVAFLLARAAILSGCGVGVVESSTLDGPRSDGGDSPAADAAELDGPAPDVLAAQLDGQLGDDATTSPDGAFVEPGSYDALVYQDGTSTIAVDKSGTVLSSGPISAQTDNIQIQAAIDAICDATPTPRKLVILPGSYTIAATVHLYRVASGNGGGLHVDGRGAAFTAAANMGSPKNCINYGITDNNVMFGLLNQGTHSGITIENLVLDGSSRNGLTGLYFLNAYPANTLSQVTTRNVTARNFNCYGPGGLPDRHSNGHGILYLGVTDSVIDNCHFERDEVGVQINGYHGTDMTPRNVTVSNCTFADIFTVNSIYYGLGIYVQRSPATLIDSCTVTRARVGVWGGEGAAADSGMTVTNCTISGCTYFGMNLGGNTDRAVITNNQIVDNLGCGLHPGTNITVTGNTFRNNGLAQGGGGSQAAIWMTEGAVYVGTPWPTITIEDNLFLDDQNPHTQVAGVYHHPGYYNADHYLWIIKNNTFNGIAQPFDMTTFTPGVVNTDISDNTIIP
jgi:hypothetical protein